MRFTFVTLCIACLVALARAQFGFGFNALRAGFGLDSPLTSARDPRQNPGPVPQDMVSYHQIVQVLEPKDLFNCSILRGTENERSLLLFLTALTLYYAEKETFQNNLLILFVFVFFLDHVFFV
ncbi:hypothetical protein GWI33_001811 [Rhynchophorus ferrugineus]|uniref:Uncharacterized protein n=1 Tax=Rhynchophorus ferrugineus TaxID=354439 RepID=A0A834IKZ7_RHYFE|nr:hypothetical protein GWI33_001811 [Rhynchophorus ferrugineus]